jgi:hypothetical protein
MDMASAPKPMNLWLPESGSDLSVYKKMLAHGHIKPFLMPDGVESLAARVMRLMEIAEESGRIKDAMKAAEILRLLAADNRAIAVELDRIERLDSGKPTSISGQLDPEQTARIKKIISTQKARANTEERNEIRGAGGTNQPSRGFSDVIGRDGQTLEVNLRPDTSGRDDSMPADSRDAGAKDRSHGEPG